MTSERPRDPNISSRDINGLYRNAAASLETALRAAAEAADVESALSALSEAVWTCLGDPTAPERPGGLKPGERQFSVSGVFLLTPDGRENVLVAEHGFPAEQRRLRIPVGLGHPGWVVENREALLLANTDDDVNFKQILKTARMGSAMYSPMIWAGAFIGQLITASQARHTYEPDDHAIHRTFAGAAAAVFQAHDGPAFLRRLAAEH